MKKYLGIVKIFDEGMSGLHITILSRTYDDLDLLNEWINLYPNSEHIILNNTIELDSMFEIFRDMTPITKEEKESMGKAKVLLRKMLKDED